jgi:hypothetical protein
MVLQERQEGARQYSRPQWFAAYTVWFAVRRLEEVCGKVLSYFI